MNKIGIISGEGRLPLEIGENLQYKDYDVHFFCLKGYANLLDYDIYNHSEIEISSFTKILDLLKINNIDQIIMVGKISRPSIKDIKFDFNTIKLIKDFFLESKGDDQLLRSISSFFENKGFKLFNWKHECTELFDSKENLSILYPSKKAYKNLKKGLDIFENIGKSDLGQSMIIQNQLILGIECIEGTNELIERSHNYKRLDDKGILLKLSKYNQHNELDLPTIGLETVINIKKFNYEGLFIEKNNCIILEKKKVINFCNQNNIFLSTVNKN